jgi:hypothetical protein
MLDVTGGNRPLFQAREHVVIVGRGTSHSHEAARAPRVALQWARNGAVADDCVVELQLRFGETKAREILIDQDRDGLAQIGRRLAIGKQNVLAVEIRERKAVARQIRSRHDAVGR